MTYDQFLNFLDQFEEIQSFRQKIAFATQNLQRIGSGSGRIVFDIDGTKVFKLAKNPKGVAQNEAEVNIGRYPDTQHIVTKVLDTDDNGNWIVSEKAKKVSEARIKQLTGIPSLTELFYYLKNHENAIKGGGQIFRQDNDVVESLVDNEFVIDLEDIMANYSIRAGDFNKTSTFGEVLRDGQPTIVIADYGLTDEVYNTHYSPRKKNQYQLYELYDVWDGNDDMLGDMPPQDAIDTRRGMWAQMPYTVDDGGGVINEGFISFVLARDKYPKKLPSAPYIIDEFHNIVNNLTEVLRYVPEKKKFYNNLLALQDWLIERKFYDRDPLLKEEYVINELTNPSRQAVQPFTLEDKNYAIELADAFAKKINIGVQPVYLDGGSNGHAFTISNDVILKITADKSEADAAGKLLNEEPKHISKIFSFYKIIDTVKNLAFFAILQENVQDKPTSEFYNYINNIDKIEPMEMDFVDILLRMRKGQVEELNEIAKHILTDNPESNISAEERELSYDYLIDLINIQEELRKYGIKSDDYGNPKNLGYKNGVLKFFDIGGYRAHEPTMMAQDIISLPEDGSAKFSTDTAMGQDEFPPYDSTDNSPSIQNDINANTNIEEDLEYRHVIGDATKDHFAMDEDRKKSYMAGSSTVDVKKKCRLGGLGNTSVACNQGDINNLEIKPIKEELNEEVNAKEMRSDIAAIKSVLGGKRGVAFVEINKAIAQKLEKKKIGVIPTRMTSRQTMMAIIYTDKVKAYLLYDFAKKNNGYLKDSTPEEAREIGKLLDYSPKDIDDHIRNKYGNKPPIMPDRSPDDFGDLAEEVEYNFWDLNEQDFHAFEKDIQQDLTTHQLDKKFIRNYQDGDHTYSVFAVNGDQVRDSGFIEWVDGGNHWVDADLPKDEQKYAKHIPENEYWIDDVFMIKPDDFEAILLHERIESFIIRHYGYEYDDAHEIANKIELMFRKNIPNGANRAVAEKIYTIFVNKFAQHHKEKKLKEGVGDKFLANKFDMKDDNEYQANKQMNIDNQEERIGSAGYNFTIIKNPKTLDGIDDDARGLIDSEGNLYVQDKVGRIHGWIIELLEKKGFIKNDEHWGKNLPTEFLTIQRWRNSNIFLAGESNMGYAPTKSRLSYLDYYKGVPTRGQTIEAAQPFFDRAKQKNPNYNFINENIDYYLHGGNAINEIFQNICEAKNTGKLNNFTEVLRKKPFIQSLINNLNADIFIVGGATRDLILNKPNKDIDLVVGKVSIDNLIQHLQKYGKVDLVGKSFGILKFIDSDGIEYDIALPRAEKPTGEGGYHGFEIQSDPNMSIETDLSRRDMKMNAMAININSGKFIDPLGGLEDIENKQISAANPEAFSDDPLRMIRMVSFASRFGFTVEPETMKMIQENAARVKEIAPERILIEFDKILKKSDVLIAAILLDETGLLKEIFGRGLYYDFRNTREPFDKVRTIGEFVYLLSKNLVNDPAEFYKTNLRGDENAYREIKALQLAFESGEATNLVEARSVAHNMYVISPTSLQSQILPNVIKVAAQELLQGKYPKTVNELAVNGNDLMQIGLQGKAIGDMQKSLLLKIYSDNVMNIKEDLLSLAKQNKPMIKEEKVERIEYGCLMLFLDVPIWSKIISVIDQDDLYIKGDDYGIEKEPHLTILYGFHDEVTPEQVFDLYKSKMPLKPIEVKIAGISTFENSEFDVVKFDVNSELLAKVNGIMRELPNTTKFPDYHAHITIAYVKKGEGKKYIKPFKKERILKGNELVYTWKGHRGKDGETLMLTDEGILKEGVADKYAEKAFNIPDTSAKQNVQAAGEIQSQQEQPVAYVRGRDASSTAIYKNPKSLDNFDRDVRGIIDPEGNIYIAQIDGDFNHGNMGMALGFMKSESDAMFKHLEKHMLIVRVKYTNAFGLSDSSADFAEDEFDYDNIQIVGNFLRAAKRVNPQYEFYPEYYEEIKGKPINEFSYDTLEPEEVSSWDVNGEKVGIPFFIQKYDEWNHQGGKNSGYKDPSEASVLEFIQNNYEDFIHDEKLKKELLWALTDRELLNE